MAAIASPHTQLADSDRCMMILILFVYLSAPAEGVRENVALGKSTYQSSSEGAAFSGRAVDGHVAYLPDRCTSAHAGPDVTLWWLVDLGDNYTISDIEITTGIENDALLSNFEVLLGTAYQPGAGFELSEFTLCNHHPGPAPRGHTIGLRCIAPGAGRFVAIAVRSKRLSLCEVKVFADAAGAGRCRFGFAADCEFSCRCEFNRVCDGQTGECPGRCMDGHPPGLHRWSGPDCQTGNVAYGKIAYQIRGNTSNTAYRAVDGRLGRPDDNEYCTLPEGDRRQSAWWYVDLGETYAVSDVIVYNQHGDWLILEDIFIRIGATPVIKDQSVCGSNKTDSNWSMVDYFTIACEERVGRYVSVAVENDYFHRSTLALCEVVVIGHKVIGGVDGVVTTTPNVTVNGVVTTTPKATAGPNDASNWSSSPVDVAPRKQLIYVAVGVVVSFIVCDFNPIYRR